jgi:hypothetical protein
MSKLEKLKARLLSEPKDFTYQELVILFSAYGFEELKKTGSSSRKLVNRETGEVFNLHEPHPEKTLKSYVIKAAIEIISLKR